MKRRRFLAQTSATVTSLAVMNALPATARNILNNQPVNDGLYNLFKNPAMQYRPFVRWWWNGDKVEKTELTRELKLLKEAGIGGVEINPIQFPSVTDDLGKPSLQWLSPAWIDMLEHTFTEAKKLGLTCDLIVGSGWPFGAEYLEGEERSQVVVIGTKRLEGPMDYEISLFDLFKEADPKFSSAFPGRQMEMLSVKLVPEQLNSLEEVVELSDQINTKTIKFKVPHGKYILYGTVKILGSMEVINGAPGANGPVLNHYNEAAVKKYLYHMSDTIQQKIGPLSNHIRAFFTDSLEIEGANWCADMAAEFQNRRGYDLMPYLPFTMYKIGSMGNTWDYKYGADLGPDLNETVERVRYDFDVTKSELIRERFIKTFTDWCKANKVKSRSQAYGRGYYPLEGSFDIDIPECETWIKYGIGKELSEADYRLGRAYSMVNKYVSSAAHLKGKRLISCEELTNTDMVFNATLEILKIAGDQSMISGVTHPVFHGFNYSPPEAPFPGWVRYGTFLNERNTFWPQFRQFTDYKARYSALLQQADMFADIAVLPPVADMWSIFGAQNEPFPSFSYPTYLTLIWESIHQNGNACDYVSDSVIEGSVMKNGQLHYGPRKYHTLFMVDVQRMQPATLEKLYAFASSGGRIFCIENEPEKSLGKNNRQQNNQQVQNWITRLKALPKNFILLPKPESNVLEWYQNLQQKYGLTPYVKIDSPNSFVTQVRYQTAGTEILLFINSDAQTAHPIKIAVNKALYAGKQAWIWEADTGNRYKLDSHNGMIELNLGPADSRLVVFDQHENGSPWLPNAVAGTQTVTPANWTIEFKHIDGTIKRAALVELKDLKDLPDFVNMAGHAVYRTQFNVTDAGKVKYVNLGQVYGLSEVSINGVSMGTKWYGRRIYPVKEALKTGLNTIEIKVTTSMGNYMKTLVDNPIAQKWTNNPRRPQPVQSMGLVGPVTLY
ncbi:glycosyl hydrolase [Mucilaginibacter sp.]|uniref:glycosyl hydrolase n=1 Tax=Mucilaginibacter sp. TaxID=1882438 RepID=UPI003B000EB1